MSVVLDSVMGPLHLARHTWQCPWFSVVPGAMHEVGQGPLKGAMSSHKDLQGSKTEMRELLERTEVNSVSLTRRHWFALQEIHRFFTCLDPLIFHFMHPPPRLLWKLSQCHSYAPTMRCILNDFSKKKTKYTSTVVYNTMWPILYYFSVEATPGEFSHQCNHEN